MQQPKHNKSIQSYLPSVIDATILLAIASAAVYVSTYFYLLSTYSIYEIPRQFIEVTLNKMIELGGIYYVLAYICMLLVFFFSKPFNKVSFILEERFWKIIDLISTYLSVCFIILNVHLFINLSFTKVLLLLVLSIPLTSVIFFSFDVHSRFERLRREWGAYYVPMLLFLILPFLTTAITLGYQSVQQEYVEIIQLNTAIETTYNKTGEQLSESKKVSKKELTSLDPDEILKSKKDQPFRNVTVILGEYQNKYIVRTLKVDKYTNKIINKNQNEFKLIPKDLEYEFRLISIQ